MKCNLQALIHASINRGFCGCLAACRAPLAVDWQRSDMFAIGWALVVSNVISCIPTIPAIVFPVNSEKFESYAAKFFDKMPSAQDLPLLNLMMKFQFGALFALYVLGVFAGIYCPTTLIGYMFAAGNLVHVLYFGFNIYGDAEKMAMSGMSAKQLNIILIVQSVLHSWPVTARRRTCKL